jgi:hypothetical protein
MTTYWNVAVSVDGRVVCSSGDETLSKAISRAISDCVYYQAVYPGSKIAVCEIAESCAKCYNQGTVNIRKPRSVKVVKCPACKGKLATGCLEPIPFAMPDAANRITLLQAV